MANASEETTSETVTSSMKFWVDIAIYVINSILPPVIGILGLFGNVLSFLLMNQKKYEKSTTCFYMRAMAIFDSLYIYSRILLRYLLVMCPYLFTDLSVKEPYCLYYFASLTLCKLVSPWILIAMALDRFIALTWPLKAAIICTMKRARITTLIIFLWSVGHGCIQLKGTYQERFKFWLCPYDFDDSAVLLYALVVEFFIPFLTLVIFNIGLLVAVHRSNRDISRSKATGSAQEASITRSAVIVISAFIAFQIPMRAVDFYWEGWKGVVTDDIQQLQRLSKNMGIIGENLNYCSNSFLYIFTCRRLRDEMFSMILRKRQ